MAAQPINPKTEKPYRPLFLPPPTELPLRHCSHNADSTPIDEIECLLSLLSPSTDVKKNKEHYILATAEPLLRKTNPNEPKRRWKTEEDKKEEEAMARSKTLRSSARSIPGVPIIYVKRSVMVLEPLSNASEMVRDGHERGKFRAGLDVDPALGKRKRDGEADGVSDTEEPKKKHGPKVKGPNPLSVKKAKKRPDAPAPKKVKEAEVGDAEADAVEADAVESKPKRKRRHNKSGPREFEGVDESEAMEVDA
jgi:U3 small nucleolar RNA-associated protein 23